ncbi:hybrid sensor histidine kinase/response regulator transcription factor [Parapedobacter tibetensis]|uniref:hybrid sensor histidine kinase/response regulator transcription factor n=1 Tax=Parapedobacter tibetensis TaxID=2972951 RepID=UPI0027E56A26|nr:response regulator [Parapedobacter tibetensis]
MCSLADVFTQLNAPQKLVNQLLDIRRIETGNERLTLENRDIVRFVADTVDTFQQLARLKNIHLETNFSFASMWISFDADKIEKVLNNLLSNALKFTNDGGQVEVGLRVEDNHIPGFVVIEVVDNGRGIAAGDMDHIFKPFQQSSFNNAGGTGLGLAYSRSLVELYGGAIAVTSTTGKGCANRTAFTVKIPKALQAPSEQPNAAALPATDATITGAEKHYEHHPIQTINGKNLRKRFTLLLVEDNPEMREYLRDCFSKQYQVLIASNGVVGLAAAIKHTPDLIVSDVMMPEMDGITLCSKLKADVLTSHIPIILLTARTPIEYEMEGIKTGADDYIIKPFNLELLSLKIKNLLLNRTRLQEKFKANITIEPSKIDPISPDEKLLKKVLGYVEERIDDSGLNVDEICTSIGLSRTQLYRKMKALTGSSIADIIKEIRLNRAKQLLKDNKFNVNEIAYMVGFTDTDYFRKCFKTKFGYSPSKYTKKYEEA